MTGVLTIKPEAPDFDVHALLPRACACGHSDAEHDAIASRFCAASAAGALERGCICRPKPVKQ